MRSELSIGTARGKGLKDLGERCPTFLEMQWSHDKVNLVGVSIIQGLGQTCSPARPQISHVGLYGCTQPHRNRGEYSALAASTAFSILHLHQLGNNDVMPQAEDLSRHSKSTPEVQGRQHYGASQKPIEPEIGEGEV
ncbi:hypothetical protein VNO77_04347 [Canavalia gladiata]|uniref:Uncharacterized protein n=1 Tax=Canavalia gladiata TaxID=3824 RepID=A0AAN9RD34_CANGL